MENVNRYKFINLKRTYKLSVLSILIIPFIISVPTKANAFTKMLGTGLTFIFTFVADCIVFVLTETKLGIDNLVFNVNNGNIAILEGNTLSDKLMIIYSFIMMIGIAMYSIRVLWLSLSFSSASARPESKAELKKKLIRSIITVILFTSTAFIFDLLLLINNTLVETFHLLTKSLVKGTEVNGDSIMKIFKALSDKNPENIILGAGYLVSTGVNLMLIGNYIVRDISITILFIVSPILISFFQDDVIKFQKFVSSLIANIFTQSIHAFIFTIIIAFASSLGNSGSYYEQFRLLAVFCMYLPLTAMVKKLLGLEGDIGAAASMAGVGGIISAFGVAASVAGGLKNGYDRFKGANNEYKNLMAEQQLETKSNQSISEVDTGNRVENNSSSSLEKQTNGTLRNGGRGIEIDPNNRNSSNKGHNVDTNVKNSHNETYSATSRSRQLQGQRVNARREKNKAIFSGAMGAVGAMVGAGLTVGSGNPYATVIGAKIGANAGEGIGNFVGDKGTDAASYVREEAKDYFYGENVRYNGDTGQELTSYFDGVEGFEVKDFMTLKPSKIKDNYEKVKSNYEKIMENKDTRIEQIKFNKKVSESQEYQDNYLGINKGDMTEDDYNKEVKALNKRNNLERRGLFDSAHRKYADMTPDRKIRFNKVPPGMQLLTSPKITGPNPDLLTSAKLNEPSTESSSLNERRTNTVNNLNKSNNIDKYNNINTVKENLNNENNIDNLRGVRDLIDNNKTSSSDKNIETKTYNVREALDKKSELYKKISARMDFDSALSIVGNSYESIHQGTKESQI